MCKNLTRVFILSVFCTITLAQTGVHIIRIRFPGPSSDKIVLHKPAKKEAPYPAAGFKPEPPFELPEATYLPPTEPELTYEPPEEVYGVPAEPEYTYGPPSNIYEPAEANDFQSAAIVNAPLTLATQFTPPRPNKAVNFRPGRPQAGTVINAPLRPVNNLIIPRPQSAVAFRPRRPQIQSQELYRKTYLTLPRVERIEFRPRRFPDQQQASNIFSRPLPSSIFGNSNNGHSGRQLPSKIFSN